MHVENYKTCDNGFALYNSKYNVIFPHDNNSNENINKYIRRFERLKNLILNKTQKICFMYTSQSSLNIGNFTIDVNNVIDNVYIHLSKIYTLIANYRNNFKMIVFDSIKEESKKDLNENIILCELIRCNT